MVKKLAKLGNSLGIVIDKPILDLLQITAETPLELTTDGQRIILTPVRALDRSKAKRIGDKIIRDHAKNLAKLAK